mgnify:CR=1 FL=1
MIDTSFILTWIGISLFILPLPYAIYKKYKFGEVSKRLAIVSTISFVLFAAFTSVFLYISSKVEGGSFGKTTISVFIISSTILYYRYITKK